MENKNPRKWRYTWEAQSHLSTLKLLLFTPNYNPSTVCHDLTAELKFEKSLINLTWKEDPQTSNLITLVVPLPRVLVDLDAALIFKCLNDHIEVKLALLLPVDHPIVSSFVSELNCGSGYSSGRFVEPLSMDSDFECLSNKGELEFGCRNCGFKLTKAPIRCLVDLPSVNWTEVADNWFGTCCCSFGGISEKMVAKYVKSYRCAEGTCLLTTASVVLCKDDLVGFKPAVVDQFRKRNGNGFGATCDANVNVCSSAESPSVCDSLPTMGPSDLKIDSSENGECAESVDDKRPSSNCTGQDVINDGALEHNCCKHEAPDSSSKDQIITAPADLQVDQKSFLNCYLGNGFLFRSSGLSKDIEWIDFACPHCSCVLGAFPSADGYEPLDGGVRLLKCCISLSSPSDASDDLLRSYTLERMFTNQLLESAKDELSFRTVVKDLKTRSPSLQIVLVNPNSWICAGHVSEDAAEPLIKIHLHPAIKVLFTHGCDNTESDLRPSQEWEMKNQADEIFMLTSVIKELVKSLETAKDAFPTSFSSSHGFLLSSMFR